MHGSTLIATSNSRHLPRLTMPHDPCPAPMTPSSCSSSVSMHVLGSPSSSTCTAFCSRAPARPSCGNVPSILMAVLTLVVQNRMSARPMETVPLQGQSCSEHSRKAHTCLTVAPPPGTSSTSCCGLSASLLLSGAHQSVPLCPLENQNRQGLVTPPWHCPRETAPQTLESLRRHKSPRSGAPPLFFLLHLASFCMPQARTPVPTPWLEAIAR